MPSTTSMVLVLMFMWPIIIPMYLVIWSRHDREKDTKWLNTVAVSIGILFATAIGWLLAPIAVVIYATYDVATRPILSGTSKSLWIVTILLLPVLGVLSYFIWALMPSNRPQTSADSPMQAL